ncbi:MAG: hypothetical protein BZY82_00400 [SAR202 cluster bacterium Io17-Chloro-G3]|nr:MAG: hypothetical protein BZY82_00400 [SAR202 cluster bacterium Io17-Chloro-G3]
MKALALEEPGKAPKFQWSEIPDPKLGPHDTLIKVLACGLCHHDLLVIRGVLRRGIRKGVVLGHEICGEVEDIGSEVSLVKPGQRVVPLLTQSCGSCARCLEGREHRCLTGQGIGHGVDGGFATHVRVRETALVPIGDSIEPEEACLLACPIGVALQGVQEACTTQDEWVMVTGASGGLGIHILQIAKALGCKTIAVTTSEGKMHGLLEKGADEVVPVGELDFVDIVRAITGEEGVGVVMDTVGSPLLASSIKCLAQFGRIILLGEVGTGTAEIHLPELMFRDARVQGSTGAQRRHVEEAAKLVSKRDVTPLIHMRLPLTDILIGLGWMEERKLFGRVVLTPN